VIRTNESGWTLSRKTSKTSRMPPRG
jgi:hypothetical protein